MYLMHHPHQARQRLKRHSSELLQSLLKVIHQEEEQNR